MSQPFKLYRLQQIDSQLDKSRVRWKAIEAELRAVEAIRQAEAQAAAAAQRLAEAEKILRHAEQEVTEQRIKIEQTESALYGGKVRNPKELQDLQNETAALKRHLSNLEDRQLDAMLAVEEQQTDEQRARTELAQVRAGVERQNASLLAEQTILKMDLQHQEAERQAAVSSIPPEDLRLYEQLRQTRNGVAVARVSEQACAACGATLNSALLVSARSPNQITRCDTCGRILYAG